MYTDLVLTAAIVAFLGGAAIAAIIEHVWDLWRFEHPHHRKGPR